MTRPSVAARLAAAFVLTAGLMAGACASPASPSPTGQPGTGAGDAPAASVRLTIRVLTRMSEAPLPAAMVSVDGATSHVDAAGTCEFDVRPGAMANVDVSAAGFVPLGASGVLMNDERWTFYLEPVS